MTDPIQFDGETESNEIRRQLATCEPIAQRTFTPSLAVLAKSAGIYHWTPEGRRLADFSSGVLVSNLGHNPTAWIQRLCHYLGWNQSLFASQEEYTLAAPLTAYNAVTPLEIRACERLLASLRQTSFGARMEQVLWSASGSEGIQKALWASLHFQPSKDIILATRKGFHGKKGLAGAVTGDERSPDRDPRVHFISFPIRESQGALADDPAVDLHHFRRELEELKVRFADRLNCLITEPYLGGGGSFHPPKAYLQMLVNFCRDNHLVFILDEVQSNFGRTGKMYAFEAYEIEPDLVVLGKGMGNGVPVNAVAGRADIMRSLHFGEASDTWSAHPMGCAAVLATLDLFESDKVMEHVARLGPIFKRGLARLLELPIVAAVRGEALVWGIELADAGAKESTQLASDVVRAAYLGDEAGNAIHLLGPLAGNVLRISPPLTITEKEAEHWLNVLFDIFRQVSETAGESI